MTANDPGATPPFPGPGTGGPAGPPGPDGPYGPYGPLPEFARGQRRIVPAVREIDGPLGRRPRRGRRGCCGGCGCFGMLLILLVGLALLYTLPNPWALSIGDRFTPTESWQGYGTVSASNGGHYELYLSLRGGLLSARSGGSLNCGGSGCDSLGGSAKVCGAAGHIYPLAVSGLVATWWSTDGAATSVNLTGSPPPPVGRVVALHGTWHGSALRLHSPDGSWTDVFTPGGKVRSVTSAVGSGRATTTIRYGDETTFDAACQRLAGRPDVSLGSMNLWRLDLCRLELLSTGFAGRKAELALLRRRLAGVTASGAGTALVIRGRRQVGKSRLAQESCDLAGAPYVFYTATKGASPVEAIADLMTELTSSGGPRDTALVPAQPTASWPDAFRVLAAVLPGSPVVIVLDELPWLAEQDEIFDGALQNAWDRLLSKRPVLLLLLGSDLHMMERLTAYDRPFFGRADNLLLGPLNPAEVGDALSLQPADAIDACLLSGGLPGILRAWPAGVPALDFAERACADPASPLFGVPEAALLAEFPAPDVSRRVIEAVGGGSRTHANIASEAGSRAGIVSSGTLTPVLRRLVEDKHVLAIDEPLSLRPGKPALYRVADSSLRFYLAIGRAAHDLSRRGRAEAAASLIVNRWASWRGRAVEPVIQEALSLAAPDLPWPEATAVGGWWNRAFDPEIDLVGADRAPVARKLWYAGSVKWLDHPFGGRDLAALQRGGPQVPGFDPAETALIGVSRAGFTESAVTELALRWLPEDIVGAFASP